MLHDPWLVSDDDYPHKGALEEQLRYALRWAVLAPSNHNTQPWRFRVEDGAVLLWADSERALPVCDPAGRELVISCGAALYHLRLALRHFGHEGLVATFPDGGDPDLLARVRPGGNLSPSPEEEWMWKAIVLRRTNRRPMQKEPLPPELLARLAHHAASEHAWLAVLDSPSVKDTVAELVAEGDLQQFADPRFRQELAEWTHYNRSGSHDGMPGYARGLADAASLVEPLVIRTFDIGEGQAARHRQLATGSPALAVLGTDGDSRGDWLAAGQALARLLLFARHHGVYASYLNQPIEVAAMRPRLAELAGRHGGFPQLLLRLGRAEDVRPTPRRPVEEVLET